MHIKKSISVTRHNLKSLTISGPLRWRFQGVPISFNPLKHGQFSQPLWHGGGEGVVRSPPNNPYWKWYQTIPLYTHSLPLIFVENFFSFEGACKRHKNLTFFKNVKIKILIFNICQKFFRNGLHTPFLPCFDTKHSIYEILFFFILFVGRSRGPKTLK